MFEKLGELDRRDHIVASILQSIRSKTLAPGGKMPPELDLCEQFGVSRTVVREAMQTLQAMGAVSVQHGRGTFVAEKPYSKPFGIWASLNAHRVEELFEVRSILESEACKRAALNRTDGDLAAMAIALEHSKQSITATDWLGALDADVEFHRSIMSAAALPLLSEMFEVAVPSWMGITSRVSTEKNRKNRLMLAYSEHLRIYDAIKNSRPEEASNAMSDHLKSACKRRIKNDRTQNMAIIQS